MHTQENLGFSPWFQNRCDTEMAVANEVTRAFSAHKDSYIISKESGDAYAELSGNLTYTENPASELPTVGDWVYANIYDDDTRDMTISRPMVGKLNDYGLKVHRLLQND